MANPTEPRREHPSTYFVQDRSNKEEMERLRVQDKMVTDSMGGVLPEQPEAGSFRRVLDIGSGSGSWVIEAAQTYPGISVFGIDISRTMVEYARQQAVVQGVSDRVEFHAMDALRMLEFPPNFFDLVNLRFGVSWVRKWDWPKLLSEMQRVTHPDGVVRVTEPDIVQISNSSALIQVQETIQRVFFQAGHLFEDGTDGLTAHLAPLLTQHGVRDVQTKSYRLEYRGGTPQGQAYYENWSHGFRTGRPFLQKWGCLTPDYDATCQQAVKEMQQSDFYAIYPIRTVWGRRP